MDRAHRRSRRAHDHGNAAAMRNLFRDQLIGLLPLVRQAIAAAPDSGGELILEQALGRVQINTA